MSTETDESDERALERRSAESAVKLRLFVIVAFPVGNGSDVGEGSRKDPLRLLWSRLLGMESSFEAG